MKKSPKNWGRWGPDDEVGTLNFLSGRDIIRAVNCVKTGKVFSLGLPIGRKNGDLMDPGRTQTVHLMVQDGSTYQVGKASPLAGGLRYSDDAVFMFLQGTTHVDALGHVWSGRKLYNGFEDTHTVGGLSKLSIEPMAKKGIVGRGVLLDIARYKRVKHLASGEPITLDDLQGAAKGQGVQIQNHDAVLVRTGFVNIFYGEGPEHYPKDQNEPGIAYGEGLVEWFHEMEISTFGADTVSAEQTISTTSDAMFPMHILLLNYLGIPIHELLWLEDLAADCERDGRYEFLYVCSPLKFVGGTASPVNPLAIK